MIDNTKALSALEAAIRKCDTAIEVREDPFTETTFIHAMHRDGRRQGIALTQADMMQMTDGQAERLLRQLETFPTLPKPLPPKPTPPPYSGPFFIIAPTRQVAEDTAKVLGAQSSYDYKWIREYRDIAALYGVTVYLAEGATEMEKFDAIEGLFILKNINVIDLME